VFKSHGDASVEAFGYAIDQAVVEAKLRVPDKIKDKIEAVLMECH
jgi:glycerol-3-phosphate acyltransferase PlsX